MTRRNSTRKEVEDIARTHRFAARRFRELWRKSRKEIRDLKALNEKKFILLRSEMDVTWALARDLNRTLDLIYAADQRGIKMWQAAHPKEEGRVWPDRGKMIFWLLEKLDAEQAVLAAIRMGERKRKVGILRKRTLRKESSHAAKEAGKRGR